MPDDFVAVDTTLSRADQAIAYMLEQIRLQADLRWLMLDTEAFDRLCDARSHVTRESKDQVKEHYRQMYPHRASAKPRIPIYREALEKIREICWEQQSRGITGATADAMMQIEAICTEARHT